MSGYTRVCHCGHEKSTHWEEQHTCLAMLCDCEAFADRDDPKPTKAAPPRLTPPPAHDTDPGIATPCLPHPMWCTCSACFMGYP